MHCAMLGLQIFRYFLRPSLKVGLKVSATQNDAQCTLLIMNAFYTNPKLYILCILNIGYISFTFQVLKIHSKLKKNRIKNQIAILFQISGFYLKYKLFCPFLFVQMAVLSSFFQMFIILGMYNFAQIKDISPGMATKVHGNRRC